MNKLKEYREKRKMSQAELAYVVGVSPRYIAFIEAGQRNPSLKLAVKMAKLFKASVEDIFLP